MMKLSKSNSTSGMCDVSKTTLKSQRPGMNRTKRMSQSKDRSQFDFNVHLESSEEKLKLTSLQTQLNEARSRCLTIEQVEKALKQTQKDLKS
jgi:hypothetical protein